MAGVAGPMLHRSATQGLRFLLGLLLGCMVAATIIATLIILLGGAAHYAIPASTRSPLLASVLAALGVMDLLHRTPQMGRQVPKIFAHSLQPGALGLVWGMDIGLLFTTRKTTSLVWAAMAVAVVTGPMPIAAFVVALTTAMAVSARSVGWKLQMKDPSTGMLVWRRTARRLRLASGVVIVGLATLFVVQAAGYS